MGSGSACGPAALTPRAPATLALSQQQHQRAACLASIVHNLDTGAAQIHYTEPLFKLKQWLSPCFITFSQQHDFTLVDWGSDVDAYFEQKKKRSSWHRLRSCRVISLSATGSTTHTNTHKKGPSSSWRTVQTDRHNRAHAKTQAQRTITLLPDCLRHADTLDRQRWVTSERGLEGLWKSGELLTEKGRI